MLRRRTMSRRLNATMIVLALTSLACVFHCAGRRELASDRPEWVDLGGGFFRGTRGRAFYGLGAASNISPESLSRGAADAQARSDLIRVFRANVRYLVTGYTAAISAGDPYRETIEDHVGEVAQVFMEMELPESEIVERWYDPKESIQYSLAVLDLSLFRIWVAQMDTLSEEVRDALLAGAERAFEEVERELGR